MMMTANYLLTAYVAGEQYLFLYEDSSDVWEVLEDFYHNDYPETLSGKKGAEYFALDVTALDDGHAIRVYELAFNASIYHYFFDHGRLTLDRFDAVLKEDRKDIDAGKPLKNDTTSFFFYMWNAWSKEECQKAFEGGNWQHFWSKWVGICEAHSVYGAAERFYAELSESNRNKLVSRALEVYDGDSMRKEEAA